MIPIQIFRLMHTNGLLRQVTNRSLLAKLRKKGYTFANCKEALELHNNDVEKAERWLRERALQYGWVQAAKLKGRNTREGLITVMVDGRYAALAEVNCETNFVAQNKKFRYLAKTVVSAILNHAESQEIRNKVQRTVFHADNLKHLLAMDGKPLSDHTALAIGNMGENINLSRALVLGVQSPDVTLFGDIYSFFPVWMNSIPVSFGQVGALVAIKCKESNTLLGKHLCEHIMIMNPQKIGDPLMDDPHKNVERCMIYQKFPYDPTSRSVQQLLAEANAEIVDFARFEVGLHEEPTLKSTQTCG